jgi:hypothetical protein
MPEGCNADTAAQKDTTAFGHMNTNNAHMSNQVSIRI